VRFFIKKRSRLSLSIPLQTLKNPVMNLGIRAGYFGSVSIQTGSVHLLAAAKYGCKMRPTYGFVRIKSGRKNETIFMKLSLDKSRTLFFIDGFSAHSVTVAKREYRHHLIITPEHLFEPWQAPGAAELGIADFDCLSRLELEVVLLGTGKNQIFPPPLLQVEFGRKGIGFEIMNTAAACRTFNILAGEGRKVAAALIIPAGGAI
jgi:uncharacterized protein